jgi:hypothetical protein
MGVREEAPMVDVVIRGVSPEVVAAIEGKAARLGLTRSEYLRRQLVRLASVADERVTAEDLRRCGERLVDLGDSEVMRGAWQ